MINCNFRDRMWKFCSCRRWFNTNNNIHFMIYTTFTDSLQLFVIICACNKVSFIGFWNCRVLSRYTPSSSYYLSIDFQISVRQSLNSDPITFFRPQARYIEFYILTIYNIHSELLIYAGIRRTPNDEWARSGYVRFADALQILKIYLAGKSRNFVDKL